MQLPATGTIFEEKYEIVDILGAGGFAKVYLARDVELGRDVALKVLEPRGGEYAAKVVARFMVEARVIAQLRDAHTIRLFEFGKSQGGLLYMVFQYVAGEDLSDVMKRTGPLPPQTVVHIAKQLLSALAEAHEVGILHRDIKPGNVLVHEYMDDPYNAKLLDFGIAKVDEAVGGVSLTKTGALLGTPRYMSPEQVFAEQLKPTTDIYSLGLVIYEMLVGRPALEGTQKDVLTEHAAEKRHYLPEHVAWPALRAVIERMLAHEPHARYQTAAEASRALDGAMAARSEPPPPHAQHSSGVAFATHGSGELPHRSSGQHVVGSSAEVHAYQANQKYYSSSQSTSQPWSRSVEVDPPRSPVVWMVLAAVVFAGAAGVWWFVNAPDAEQPVVRRRAPVVPDELLKRSATPTPPVEERTVVEDAGPPLITPIDLAPSQGCGKIHPAEEERWIQTGVPERVARVYLPNDYDAERAYPLVMSFGPKYVTEGNFAKHAGLSALAVGNEFILVAVSAANRFDPWEDEDGDLAATRGALDEMKRQFCIDPSRVYAVGHHDGARYLRDAACSIPFSGIALSGFAEKIGRQRCDMHPHVPTILVAGLNDDFIPIEGGMGCTNNGPYRTIDEHEQHWVDRYRCKDEPTRFSKSDTSECRIWKDCDAPLALCRAEGGHHVSSSDWKILYLTCHGDQLDFAVGEEAWAFFQKHGKPISPLDPRHVR